MANKYTAYTYITDTEKQCSLCREIKDLSAFHKDSKNIRGKGVGYYCKDCANKKARSWHKDNSDNIVYREKKRNNYVKNKHSISLEEYQEKLAKQNHRCIICERELPTSGNITHLDHNHTTGKIRDFLCTNCNRGLGHFQDNKDLLMKAALYLESHTENGSQEMESRL